MTVAVENGLENIKKSLAKKGYNVVDTGKSSIADAYVFSGKCGGVLSQNLSYAPQNGILMINAQNKTPDDIDRILKSRLYGPLFIF